MLLHPFPSFRVQPTPSAPSPQRVWEHNSQGSIPYVPYLRAPYYVWVGRPWGDAAKQLVHEQRVEAPPLFPPTFLYTQSWEDPEPDMKVRKWSLLGLDACSFGVWVRVAWHSVGFSSVHWSARHWYFLVLFLLGLGAGVPPPTLLYTQSWEDPEPDMKMRRRGCLIRSTWC